MRLWLRRAAWTLGILLGVPLASIIVLYAMADTSPGRWALEGLIGFATAGEVKVYDLAGEFPRRPRIGRIEISDEKGIWLTLDNVAIDWSPGRLPHNEAQVASLFVDHAYVARMPVSKATTAKSTFRSVVQAMTVRRADIAPALAGRPISVRLDGSVNYVSTSDVHWNLAVRQIGGPGVYASNGAIDGNVVTARVNAREPAGGLLGGTAGLPNLGAIVLDASVLGSRGGETLALVLDAGALSARASGQLDLVGRTAHLDINARAPRMEPRPGVSWSGMLFEGHLLGPFSKPEVNGHLAITELRANGVSAATIAGDVSGHAGALTANAIATRVVLPGPQPEFLASAPIQLSLQARLDGRAPVASYVLQHPLMVVRGDASLGGHIVDNTTLTIARLAPFAAMSGVALDGSATLTVHLDSADNVSHAKVDAAVNAAGETMPARVLGHNARFTASATASGSTVTLDSETVTAAGLNFTAHGTRTSEQNAFAWSAAFPDLSRFAPGVAGNISLHGSLNGKPDDLTVALNAFGSVATKGFPRGPIEANVRASGLPGRPRGDLTVSGRFDSAPLRLSAAFEAKSAKSPIHINLKSADWRSVRARGDFVLPWTAKGLAGHTNLHVGDLADIGILTGAVVKGSLDAAIAIASEKGRTVAHLHAVAAKAEFGSARAAGTTVDGTVADPLGKPVLALGLKATGLAANGYSGNVNGRIAGPLDAIVANVDADAKDAAGNPARIAARTTVDTAKKRAALSQLNVNYRGDAFRLTAPAHVDFANGLAVDRLQLASGKTSIQIAGRVTPKLAMALAVRNATPDLVRPFAPSLNADGVFSVQAKLTGSLAAPGGTVVFTGNGLKLRGESSVPPANVMARATLRGQAMAINAKIGAGTSAALNLSGEAPLSASGRFNLRANGAVDLTSLDPVLNPSGKRLRGRATINGGFQGTLAQPRLSGTAVLTGGDFQDFVQGLHLQDLSARIEARGDTIAVRQLSGRAGHGTISGSGTIAVWAPGAPVNIAIKMKNARPFTTDRLTTSVDADLKLVGRLSDGLTLTGPITVGRGDINIAASLPPSVVVLNVRRRGAPPMPPLRSQGPTTSAMKLDLTVNAPGGLYVRGRGLDSEVQGEIKVKGTVAQPYVSGGFELRRGTLDLAGKTLDITQGKITFDGRSLNGSFDPAIAFLAANTTGNFTAKLGMTGHASAPVITLSSTPSMPQDEVLSHLLFGENMSQLSPLELAQVAEGLSTLMGSGGGFNPLSSARRSLGLDRLAVGGTQTGNGASVEAGKNVSRGLYVGAKQDTSGGTQAMVQVDLTKHLKLQTTLSTGFGAQQSSTTIPTPQTDRGSSVGLSYEFEY
jgi:translocation and assembly module TamB